MSEVVKAYEKAKKDYELKMRLCAEVERSYLQELASYLMIGFDSVGVERTFFNDTNYDNQREYIKSSFTIRPSKALGITFVLRIDKKEWLSFQHLLRWDGDSISVKQFDRWYKIDPVIDPSLNTYRGSFEKSMYEDIKQKILKLYQDETEVFMDHSHKTKPTIRDLDKVQ